VHRLEFITLSRRRTRPAARGAFAATGDARWSDLSVARGPRNDELVAAFHHGLRKSGYVAGPQRHDRIPAVPQVIWAAAVLWAAIWSAVRWP